MFDQVTFKPTGKGGNPWEYSNLHKTDIAFAAVIATIGLASIPLMFVAPPVGMAIGAVVFIVTAALYLVQSIVTRRASPKAKNIFYAEQFDITSLYTQIEQNVIMDEQSISAENFASQLKTQYKLYENASHNQDLNSKLDVLESIRVLFNQARAGSSLFVSGEFLNNTAAYYLLRMEGTWKF